MPLRRSTEGLEFDEIDLNMKRVPRRAEPGFGLLDGTPGAASAGALPASVVGQNRLT
jgi:hypothetical protein